MVCPTMSWICSWSGLIISLINSVIWPQHIDIVGSSYRRYEISIYFYRYGPYSLGTPRPVRTLLSCPGVPLESASESLYGRPRDTECAEGRSDRLATPWPNQGGPGGEVFVTRRGCDRVKRPAHVFSVTANIYTMCLVEKEKGIPSAVVRVLHLSAGIFIRPAVWAASPIQLPGRGQMALLPNHFRLP